MPQQQQIKTYECARVNVFNVCTEWVEVMPAPTSQLVIPPEQKALLATAILVFMAKVWVFQLIKRSIL